MGSIPDRELLSPATWSLFVTHLVIWIGEIVLTVIGLAVIYFIMFYGLSLL